MKSILLLALFCIGCSTFAAEPHKPITCIKQTHEHKMCVIMSPFFDENGKEKKCVVDDPYLKPVGIEITDGKVKGYWECTYCFRCED